MRTPPIQARDQFGAFTRQQALASGWTDGALRHAVATDRLLRLRPGVFAAPIESDQAGHTAAHARAAAQVAAVLLTVPRAVASHASAAVLRGLPVLELPRVPCATVARDYTGDLAGAHLHRAALRPGERVRRGELYATAPPRTVVDVSREAGVAAGLVVADAALARGLTDRRALDRAVAMCAGWPGLRAARQVTALADPRAESPLESLSRLEFAVSTLPMPDLQTDLLDLEGHHLGRSDFYWDEFGVVGEADGAEKYDGPDVLYREKRRQDRMDDSGLVVVRWGWREATVPGRVAAMAERAITRAQQRRARRGWWVRPSPLRPHDRC